MAGLTDKGFEVKEFNDILRDLRREASSSFSDLVPDGDAVDVSDSSVIGRLTKLVAPSLADLWEAAQDVYTSFDPDSSSGESLDNLVKYSRIERRGAESSTAIVKLIAEEGLVLPDNSSVASVDGQSWSLPPAIRFSRTLSSNGAFVSFTLPDLEEAVGLGFSVAGITYSATTRGNGAETLLDFTNRFVEELKTSADAVSVVTVSEGLIKVERNIDFNDTIFTARNCEILDIIKTSTAVSLRKEGISAFAGEINRIETPILGWKSVSNPYDANVGRPRETDEELRERFKDSKFTLGYTSVDAIYSKLRGIDAIFDIVIYENNTDLVDRFGVDPHSFMPIVLGGDDGEIAQTIWYNRPLGIKSQGNTEATVVSIDKKSKSEWFERPAQVPVKIKVELVKEYDFPENGVGMIKNNILDYFRNNYRIGEHVYYSKLFMPINQVQGQHISLLQLSKKDEALGYNNIPLEFNEVAVISYEDIEVIVS